MKATYQNRYGDDIIFEKLDDNTIKMSGFKYSRTGYNDDESIDFVDPSGGPFIQIGTNVGRYFKGEPQMIVKSIEWNENETLLKI